MNYLNKIIRTPWVMGPIHLFVLISLTWGSILSLIYLCSWILVGALMINMYYGKTDFKKDEAFETKKLIYAVSIAGIYIFILPLFLVSIIIDVSKKRNLGSIVSYVLQRL